LSESKQLLKNGRIASIKFGTSESQDYTSEAKSKFVDQPGKLAYTNDSQKYKIKFQTSNIPTDPHADRAYTMQTVAMATENLKGNQQNNDYQNIGVEVKNLRSAMAKSNFNMGQILPEHKHIDIAAIN
jgi:hypothetical protein